MEILLHPQYSTLQSSTVLAGIKTKRSSSCIKPLRSGSCSVSPWWLCSPKPAPAATTAPGSSLVPSVAFQVLPQSLQSRLPKKWQYFRTFILSLDPLLNYARCPSQGQVSPNGVETSGAASPPGTSRIIRRTFYV